QAGSERLWRQKSGRPSASGRPGVVVAADARPPVLAEDRAFGTVSLCTAGEILDVRLLPLARLVVLFRGRRVDAVGDPAGRARRDGRGLAIPVVDPPPPRAALRIGAALVIDVARLVLADALSHPPGVELRAEGLAVPPGEEFQQEFLHRRPRRVKASD